MGKEEEELLTDESYWHCHEIWEIKIWHEILELMKAEKPRSQRMAVLMGRTAQRGTKGSHRRGRWMDFAHPSSVRPGTLYREEGDCSQGCLKISPSCRKDI